MEAAGGRQRRTGKLKNQGIGQGKVARLLLLHVPGRTNP